jgi:hypothetical protein
MINTVHQQSSIFNYDPELDLSEKDLSLVSKRLLTTLRESKIKHLSCDNLFLPCNHIRNIARQCLIMSAEEPFGIMGAQIKIKLTLLSSNMTTTVTKYLPIIQIDPKKKTTFEIEIDLHEDTKVFTLKHFLPSIKMFKQIKERSPLYVSPRLLLIHPDKLNRTKFLFKYSTNKKKGKQIFKLHFTFFFFLCRQYLFA